jgi:protein involved in polysaccharide export with SLBB domain
MEGQMRRRASSGKRLVIGLASVQAVVLFQLICAPLSAAEPEQTELVLAPGDNLKFDILDDQKDPVDLPIGTDGQIQAPLLGAVPVAGHTIAEALKQVEERYRKQQIFVTPRISLSVGTYRPVFVLGDVRNPGIYPFQPELTVEKALGLAGGQSIGSGSENPIALELRLRAALDVSATSIAKSALTLARLEAQRQGHADILPENIPSEAQPYLHGPVANAFREVELDILKSDAQTFETKRRMLIEGIAEAENGHKNLEQLSIKTGESLRFSREELARAKALHEKGIKTLNDVSNVSRQLMLEEARELQVLTTLSEAKRGLLNLKRQIVEIDEARQMKLLADTRLERSNLANALAERRSSEQQLALLSGHTMDAFRTMRELVLDFAIRRGSGSNIRDIDATSTTSIMPGDVLMIKTRNPTDAVASVPDNVQTR